MHDEAGMRETLALLATEVEAVNQNLAAENIKRDQRIAASEKVQRQNRVVIIITSVVAVLALVAAGLGIAYGVEAHNRVTDICKNGNEVRTEVVGLVGDFLGNSERTQKATLASPLSTPEQKAAATRNLQAIQDAEQKAQGRLALKDC